MEMSVSTPMNTRFIRMMMLDTISKALLKHSMCGSTVVGRVFFLLQPCTAFNICTLTPFWSFCSSCFNLERDDEDCPALPGRRASQRDFVNVDDPPPTSLARPPWSFFSSTSRFGGPGPASCIAGAMAIAWPSAVAALIPLTPALPSRSTWETSSSTIRMCCLCSADNLSSQVLLILDTTCSSKRRSTLMRDMPGASSCSRLNGAIDRLLVRVDSLSKASAVSKWMASARFSCSLDFKVTMSITSLNFEVITVTMSSCQPANCFPIKSPTRAICSSSCSWR
mmetsp:Transcript_103659/g.323100  ORF Transcript_103659/g.323100 Transcript_103659/m.323100 type:complete len:281 (+) Transcript_103659:1205-2047(+)